MSIRRSSGRGPRMNEGDRSGCASRISSPRRRSAPTTGPRSGAYGASGHSSSSHGPSPSVRLRRSSSPSPSLRPIATSPPWTTSSSVPSAARRSATRARACANWAGSTAKSRLMWDVAAITRVPAAVAATAISTLPSSVAGPSSSPGRMWAWRSITPRMIAPRMFRSIVVGTDGSDTARQAVRQAVALAAAVGASSEVVCAYEPVAGQRLRDDARAAPPDLQWTINAREDVEATLREAAAEVEAAGVPVATYAREGDPADAILDVAEERGADLIVVGNKGMTGAKRFLLGSVPNKVSHHAPCSVLIIRTS